MLRSTVAPGTTEFVAGYLEKQRGFRVGEDIFVAHVPERIAADRFMDEIAHAAVHHRRRRRGARASARRGCSSRSARRSCRPRRCRPSWRRSGPTSCATRRSRCPNLLMMDCERHGANVFDVIELINRDYPRGGMAQPGLTAGTCLRKDFAFSEERSSAPGHAARGLARARDRAAVPGRRRQAPARRVACASARSPCSAWRFKADTDDERDSLVAQADPPARARAGRRRRCTTRSSPRRRARFEDAVDRRRRRSSSPPTTARTRRPPRCARSPSSRAGRAARGPLERARHGAGVRLRRRGGGAAGA